MKRKVSILVVCVMLLSMMAPTVSAVQSTDKTEVTAGDQAEQSKVRTIITTDGEVDDMDSFLRMLLYANEFDIIGMIISSSTYHYAGNGDDIEAYRWLGTKWIDYYLDRYEEVYDTLSQHADGYPTADELRSLVKIGNITNVGEMEEDTEGSDHIKSILLDDDEDEVYVQVWGGTNTLARALKSIEDEYKDTDQWEEIYQKVCAKTSMYIVLDQDVTHKNYISVNWPDITVIKNTTVFWSFAYMHTNTTRVPSEIRSQYLKGNWFQDNIFGINSPLLNEYMTHGDGHNLVNIGALGSAHKFGDDDHPEWGELEDEDRGNPDNIRSGYEQYDFISEGDSVSYFYLVDNGLRSYEDPSYGGWSGRFVQTDENLWTDDAYDESPYSSSATAQQSWTLVRWFDAIQNDFAARAEWTVKDYDEANHHPEVSVTTGLDISAVPGQTIQLEAEAGDPDGDNLAYSWWQYAEVDTYDGEITIAANDTLTPSITIPADAKAGDTIHLILEVQDDAEKGLTSYQRVIVTVAERADNTKLLDYYIDYAQRQIEEGALDTVIQAVTEKFYAVLENAVSVLEGAKADPSYVSQEQVDAAVVDLLEVFQYLDFKQADKSELIQLVDLVEKFEQNQSLYTPGTYDTFQKALDNARTIIADQNEMDADVVTDAWTTLAEATASLRYIPNKDLLAFVIEQGKTYNLSFYTASSAERLSTALIIGEAVLNDDDAEEAEVKQAENAVTEAIDGLVLQTGVENESSSEDTDAGNASSAAIDDKQTTSNPKTGDNSWIVFALMISSLSAAIMLYRRKKSA